MRANVRFKVPSRRKKPMTNIYKDLRTWARSLAEIGLRARSCLWAQKTSQMVVKRKHIAFAFDVLTI
jgi:hypothetical protein